MATATIPLLLSAAVPPDGSTNNAAAQPLRVKGSDSAPSKHYLAYAFDAATDEHLWFTFRMPTDYASAPVLKLQWQSNDTGAGETCVWGCKLGAVTPADADTPNEHAMATAQTTSSDVNTTEANRLIETSITISNADSVAAGDLVFLLIYRDADNGSDDLSSDALLLAAAVEYTTT